MQAQLEMHNVSTIKGFGCKVVIWVSGHEPNAVPAKPEDRPDIYQPQDFSWTCWRFAPNSISPSLEPMAAQPEPRSGEELSRPPGPISLRGAHSQFWSRSCVVLSVFNFNSIFMSWHHACTCVSLRAGNLPRTAWDPCGSRLRDRHW